MKSTLQIAAFDLDRTLFKGNSSLLFCLHLIRKKRLPRFALIYSIYCYMLLQWGKLTLKELHKKIFFRFLFGFALSDLKQEVEAFISTLKSDAFYAPAWRRFTQAKNRGDVTLLLSSSPHFLVGPLASFMGFTEWCATSYSVDKEGRLCNISSVLEGADKARLLQELATKKGIKIENTIAYSDSYLDLPLLQAAGEAVAVNPDRKLVRISQARKWLTL